MGASAELQKHIIATLRDDAAVGAICGDRVYDKAPKSAAFPYITLGNSDYISDDADCIVARVETFQVDIWSRQQGSKVECRELTDAAKTALHESTGDIGTHALVDCRVTLARVMGDPDGITTHGVLFVEANIEEN